MGVTKNMKETMENMMFLWTSAVRMIRQKLGIEVGGKSRKSR